MYATPRRFLVGSHGGPVHRRAGHAKCTDKGLTLPSELDPLLTAVTIGRPSIQETRAMVCGFPAPRTTRRAITGVVTCWAVEWVST